jgi:uncharacterized membrane protein YheB (UPF0754 family)
MLMVRVSFKVTVCLGFVLGLVLGLGQGYCLVRSRSGVGLR